MPRGRKIMLGIVAVNLDYFRSMFKLYGTKCEHSECSADPAPAYGEYQNGVVFMYLCEPHYVRVHALTGWDKILWDKEAASRMRSFMDRLSFVKMNMASNFELENAVDARAEVQAAAVAAEKAEAGRVRRNLRKQIRESTDKVGSPDESLAAARVNRADSKAGPAASRPIKPQATGTMGLLIPRLVIGDTVTKEESQ